MMVMNSFTKASIRERAELDGLMTEALDPNLTPDIAASLETRMLTSFAKLTPGEQVRVFKHPIWKKILDKAMHTADLQTQIAIQECVRTEILQEKPFLGALRQRFAAWLKGILIPRL